MAPPSPAQRFAMIETDRKEHHDSFADAVRAGLTGERKTLPYRFLYDEAGSELFEEICELPEYYLTRTEREILEERVGEIAAAFSGPITLAELGSGSSSKTRLLIEALLRAHGRLRYVPVDISRGMLKRSAFELLERYEALEVRAFAGEYRDGLRHVQSENARPKLVVWLGSSVGNLTREEATDFLAGVRGAMNGADRLLIGIDLRKDRWILEAAYDDAAGVTARFTLNLLERINRELGGRFDTGAFQHRAVYLEEEGRVEIQIVSRREQRVAIEALGLEVRFAAGEGIHAENAFKYSADEIAKITGAAGLRVEHTWCDSGERYSLSLLAPLP
jgi:dimethylhistidine N-methyltransferase